MQYFLFLIPLFFQIFDDSYCFEKPGRGSSSAGTADKRSCLRQHERTSGRSQPRRAAERWSWSHRTLKLHLGPKILCWIGCRCWITHSQQVCVITTGLLLLSGTSRPRNQRIFNFLCSWNIGISDYIQYFIIAFVSESEVLLRTQFCHSCSKTRILYVNRYALLCCAICFYDKCIMAGWYDQKDTSVQCYSLYYVIYWKIIIQLC